MKRTVELKRAAALMDQLNAVSGNEKLLDAEQLVWLRKWKGRHNSAATAAVSDEEAAAYYAASLEVDNFNPDPIRPDIERILKRDVPIIYKSDTEDQAAEKYYQYIQN